MRIDLHTHSRASDGTDAPAALVRAAVDAGLDVLAITDHDTSDGWAEAAQAAAETGLTAILSVLRDKQAICIARERSVAV